MQFIVIKDLLAGQTSCSAGLSMKKKYINSGPGLITRSEHPPKIVDRFIPCFHYLL